MEGFESLVSAIEELGRKVERMESTLNQWNAKALQEEEPEKSVLVCAEGEFSVEDDLDRMEEDLLFASCELVKMYEELGDNSDREDIYFGRLDEVKFMDACIRQIEEDEKQMMELAAESVEITYEVKQVWKKYVSDLHKKLESSTFERAAELHTLWQTRIFEYGLAIEAKEKILFKPYDEELEKVRKIYGVDLYRTIRQGFREMRVALRTRVFKKPWNVQAGREASLSEILVPLQELVVEQKIQRRNRIRRRRG